MALCAIRRPIQWLVCFRKRSWGKLCTNGKPIESRQNEKNGDEKTTLDERGGTFLIGLRFGQHRVSGNGAGPFLLDNFFYRKG